MKLDLMSRKGITSRKRSILLNVLKILILMMKKRSHLQSGFRTIRSQSHAYLEKKEPEKYGFDITKADKIFDLLLSEGQIKLKPYHKIPSAEELKNMKYCKWHNATSHDTNECKVFRQQIQSAIEQGRL